MKLYLYIGLAAIVSLASWKANSVWTEYQDQKQVIEQKDEKILTLLQDKADAIAQTKQFDADVLAWQEREKAWQETERKYQIEIGHFKKQFRTLKSTDNAELSKYERLYKECLDRRVPDQFY